MKNILCFGDSNTWGYAPVTKQRFDESTRWTGVLQKQIGQECRIIEEGLNGRTTVHNEEDRPFRSGAEMLPVLMESHAPIDLVIIMLGTNDLKSKFNSTPQQIAENMKSVCQLALNNEYNPNVQVLLISPTLVVDMNKEDQTEFKGAVEKSLEFANEYKKVAKDLNLHFLDAATLVQTSTEDGIHWNANQHRDFGSRIAKEISSLLI